MGRRYTFAACLTWGGDVQTGEAEVECSYTVSWGRPATGPSYASGGEPADPDEIDDVRILTVDGKPWPVDMSYGCRTPAQDHEMLVDKLLSDHYDDMLDVAGMTTIVETLRALAGRYRADAEEAAAEADRVRFGLLYSLGHLRGQALAFLQAAEDLERLIAREIVRAQLAASLEALAEDER